MSTAVSFSLAPMRRLQADPIQVLRRHRRKVIGLAALAFIVGLSIPFKRLFVINPTDSLPRGIYMKSSSQIGDRRGDRAPHTPIGARQSCGAF